MATVAARFVAASDSDKTKVVSGLPSTNSPSNCCMSGGKVRLVTELLLRFRKTRAVRPGGKFRVLNLLLESPSVFNLLRSGGKLTFVS